MSDLLSRLQEEAWDEASLTAPPCALTPEQIASFRALLRDSLGITWETRGKVTTVHPPLPLAAATSLPIPVGLLALTLAWRNARRPCRRSRILW